MDSQDSSIEEKLVPFVEGALAEADRREVLQALPSQPALNQEVRALRETIMSLRGQAARGLTYQSPVEAPPEQVVDFALQGEGWSRQSSRQFQLHLLESSSLAEELSILRELEQDLQQRVEPSKAVPEMPAALRQAIQETYGKPPADPAWKRAAAAILAWTAGLNLKVASAAVAGCVLIVGAVTVSRMNRPTSGTTVAVATTAPVADSSATPLGAVAAATPEPAPAGQVALLQEKVLPEDLPGLSRRLWTKQVSHSYRDGQIYVAQADFDKAWSALQMNNEKATGSKRLKTGEVAVNEPETNLLDGVIGKLPAKDTKAEEVKLKKQPAPAGPQGSAGGPSAEATKAPTGTMVGGVPDSQVAIAIPAQPEAAAQAGTYAPPPAPAYQAPAHHYQRQEPARPVDPIVPRQTAPAPAPVRTRHVAASTSQTTAHPSQAAHPAPAPMADKDPGSSTKIGQVFQADARKQNPGAKNNGPVDQVASDYRPEPAPEPIAPPLEALKKPVAQSHPVTSYAPPPPPLKPTTPAVAAPVQTGMTNMSVPPTEDDAPPPPGQVFQEKKGDLSREKSETEEGRVNNTMRTDDGVVRSNTNKTVGYTDSAGAGRASMGNQAARSRTANDESFQVKAGAPFEVAMLPVAKKLVEDLVGESKVQMERKEDGHLLVTIRPARSLSPQEVDKLRKVVREKLELKEEDTVVIRQP